MVFYMFCYRPVCEFHQPENLKSMLRELKITDEAASEDKLLDMVKNVIQYSVKTCEIFSSFFSISVLCSCKNITYFDKSERQMFGN